MSSVLTVDPGISGTGYAIWTPDMRLRTSGNIYAPRNFGWQEKGYYIKDEIRDLISEFNIKQMHIECPAFFGGSGGRMVAARGDLVKLTWFVGIISNLGVTPQLVRVIDWKGQLPKEVVEDRIKQILPERVWKNIKAHAWDAVGIGLYLRGDFK